MKLSEYIFQFLKKVQVEQVFMLPGGGAMHLNDSLGKSGIPYICFLHEQAAAIAAEAYAQHTNNPGVLLVTSGPGGTNAITGVTAGWLDSTPMFVISGQSKRADLIRDTGSRQIGSQEVQIVDMIKPITKYAIQILEPKDIRYHLERAWFETKNGRPGPVWLDIPLDVQASEIDENGLVGFKLKVEEMSTEIYDYEKAVNLILQSKKPILIAGNGIKIAAGNENLKKLLEIIPIPVQTTWKTIDMFDEEDACYIGHPGIMGDRAANMLIQEADLIISVGSRLDASITAFNEENFGIKAKKILVDIDINELNRMNMKKELVFCQDADAFLTSLNSELIKPAYKEKLFSKNEEFRNWLMECKNLRKKYPVVTFENRSYQNKISAYYFIDKLCECLNSEDVIVPESSGGAGEITYQAFRIKKGQKMKNAAALGSMGFGLPYAIGACIANKRKRTILINGDGAFQLNIQELATLKHLNLPVIIFIWSNEGYASIRNMQRNNFQSNYVGCNYNSGLSIPSITDVAKAYGLITYKIDNHDQLDYMLPQILDHNEPVLCELLVLPDETVSPRIKARVLENGNIVSDLLNHMWPYLDEEK